MKKANSSAKSDELRSEYDLSALQGAVRGKYAKRFREGTNLVLLTPEIASYFPDDNSVNAALKSLVGIAKASLRQAH